MTPPSLRRRCLPALLPLVLLLQGGLPAPATRLLFENTSGFNLSAIFPQSYGDRITNTAQNGFRYELTGGATPNVEVSYLNPGAWSTGYGNLTNLVYVRSPGPLEITLAADPGFEVRLHGFDLGAWFQTNLVLGSLRVTDLGGSILYAQENLLVQGQPGTRTSLSFTNPLHARVVRIVIDSSNLGSSGLQNIGIDNLLFSQAMVPVYTDIELFPGVKVYGTPGRHYRIDFVDGVTNPTWTPLATLLLTNNPTVHVDLVPPGTPRRYYRAVELAP
ncbi:MAG: hypothetical protein RJA22_3133 [Verrucomicrobiota bacterium]|jgi:hypothetical protein